MDRREFLTTAAANVSAVAIAANGVAAVAQNSSASSRARTPSQASPEVAVVGAGAFGGWTALYLREQGREVTLIDQYGPGNALASSGGESRQIRAGYGDREIYTRWVLKAFDRWEARQKEWGRDLFFRTGGLTLASEWTDNLTGTRKAFDKYHVPYEVIKHDDLGRRFPQISNEGVDFGFYTPTTGVLKAREGCVAVAHAFQQKGGSFLTARATLGRRDGRRLREVTLSTGNTVSAQTFVFALGPWLPKVFPEVLKNKLQSPRRVVFFVGTPPGDERFTYPNFPAWSAGGAYGFPSVEGRGFKLAPHIDDVLVDPDRQQRVLTAEEIQKGREFVARWFPTLKDQPSSRARSASTRTASTSTSSSTVIPTSTTCGWWAAAQVTATNTASCSVSM
ncbi:MAG: FAD-dependent oxidoreductase [Gammaproteobacteria bacterium]